MNLKLWQNMSVSGININMRRGLIILIVLGCGIAGCTASALINSHPPGARVYLDNKEIGVTPLTLDVPIGTKGTSRQIALAKDGYEKVTDAITNTNISAASIVLSVVFFAPALFFVWQPEDEYTFTLKEIVQTLPEDISIAGLSPPITPTLPRTSSRLKYDFDDPAELSDWKPVSGKWQVAGGALSGKGPGSVQIQLPKTDRKITGYTGTLKIDLCPPGTTITIWFNHNLTYAMYVKPDESSVTISDKKNIITRKVGSLEPGQDWSFAVKERIPPEGKEKDGNIQFSIDYTVIGSFPAVEPIDSLTIRAANPGKQEIGIVIDKVAITTPEDAKNPR